MYVDGLKQALILFERAGVARLGHHGEDGAVAQTYEGPRQQKLQKLQNAEFGIIQSCCHHPSLP